MFGLDDFDRAVFGSFENYYVLVITAILGILTPSGGKLVHLEQLSKVLLHHWFLMRRDQTFMLGIRFWNILCCLWVILGRSIDRHCSGQLWVHHSAKLQMCILGLHVVIWYMCYFMFIHHGNIEVKPDPGLEEPATTPEDNESEPTETSQLIPTTGNVTNKPKNKFRLLPHLSPDTYLLVIKLSLLFGLDSFASSLTPISWISYYIKTSLMYHHLIWVQFFTTGFVSGFTSLGSTPLTKRFGAVVTMVFTHLPASILLALVPFPSSFSLTMGILVVRACTQTMDVAPKHVFLATLVSDSDRTAVFGFVNVVKTLAQVVGPSIVGVITNVVPNGFRLLLLGH